MIVCTLCSCYPWEVLGLPPVWYKSAPYRSRAVNDPRGVLADFGVTLPADTEIRVWDSTAETRFIVLPMRPAGHRRLERGKTRDAGHARQHDRHRPAEAAAARSRDGRHPRHGRHARLRQSRARAGRAGLSRRMGRPRARAQRAPWATPASGQSTSRAPRIEKLPPEVYLSSSYYKRWALRTGKPVSSLASPAPTRLQAGHALRPGKPLNASSAPPTCRAR